MTENAADTLGKNTQHALNAVRELFVNLQILLLEVDHLMRDAKWSAKGNQCTRGQSGSIDWPRLWMPYSVWRYYKHSAQQDVLPAVFALLGDPDHGDRLEEPLVGGLVVRGNGAANDDPGHFGEYAAGHLNASPQTEKGKWGRSIRHIEKNGTVREVESFGVPLATLRGAVDLRSYVTDPLLQLVGGRHA